MASPEEIAAGLSEAQREFLLGIKEVKSNVVGKYYDNVHGGFAKYPWFLATTFFDLGIFTFTIAPLMWTDGFSISGSLTPLGVAVRGALKGDE